MWSSSELKLQKWCNCLTLTGWPRPLTSQPSTQVTAAFLVTIALKVGAAAYPSVPGAPARCQGRVNRAITFLISLNALVPRRAGQLLANHCHLPADMLWPTLATQARAVRAAITVAHLPLSWELFPVAAGTTSTLIVQYTHGVQWTVGFSTRLIRIAPTTHEWAAERWLIIHSFLLYLGSEINSSGYIYAGGIWMLKWLVHYSLMAKVSSSNPVHSPYSPSCSNGYQVVLFCFVFLWSWKKKGSQAGCWPPHSLVCSDRPRKIQAPTPSSLGASTAWQGLFLSDLIYLFWNQLKWLHLVA